VHRADDALAGDERHRGAVGGVDGERRSRAAGDRRVGRHPGRVAGRLDHDDVGAVDLAQPRPRQVEHAAAGGRDGRVRLQDRQVAVERAGEAHVGPAATVDGDDGVVEDELGHRSPVT
jgi:hypothetical protein